MSSDQKSQSLRILVLCTGNSCRSILAEALLNHRGGPDLQAFSAGSQPTGEVHPMALNCLKENGIPMETPRSKSWNEFQNTELDLVITVCDNAAAESCPTYPGEPIKLHWGLPDPAKATGNSAAIRQAFQQTFDSLDTLIAALLRGQAQHSGAKIADWVTTLDFASLLARQAS